MTFLAISNEFYSKSELFLKKFPFLVAFFAKKYQIHRVEFWKKPNNSTS